MEMKDIIAYAMLFLGFIIFIVSFLIKDLVKDEITLISMRCWGFILMFSPVFIILFW